jgi:hypothetical protein
VSLLMIQGSRGEPARRTEAALPMSEKVANQQTYYFKTSPVREFPNVGRIVGRNAVPFRESVLTKKPPEGGS